MLPRLPLKMVSKWKAFLPAAAPPAEGFPFPTKETEGSATPHLSYAVGLASRRGSFERGRSGQFVFFWRLMGVPLNRPLKSSLLRRT